MTMGAKGSGPAFGPALHPAHRWPKKFLLRHIKATDFYSKKALSIAILPGPFNRPLALTPWVPPKTEHFCLPLYPLSKRAARSGPKGDTIDKIEVDRHRKGRPALKVA